MTTQVAGTRKGKAHKKGFARWKQGKLKAISAYAGQRSHELGRAYTFTSDAARSARLKYLKTREDHSPLLLSRKRCATCERDIGDHRRRRHAYKPRYEYYVDGVGWVTRQRVSQLRQLGKLK